MFTKKSLIKCIKSHPSNFSKKFTQRKYVCEKCGNEINTFSSEEDRITEKDIKNLPDYCKHCGRKLIKKGIIEEKFINWLENDSEDCGLFSPPLNAQKALYFLKHYLLGEDWYVTDPISTEQVNTHIVYEILYKHSRKFRKEWKKYKKRKGKC